MGKPVLLTSAEAAAHIQVCEKTLRHLRQAGHIRYVAITERKIRYRPEDCDAYLTSRLREEAICPPTSRRTRPSSSMTSRSQDPQNQ